MSNPTAEKLLCRLLGHRWKPSYVLMPVEFNRAIVSVWVYDCDTCQRCYKWEYRLGEWERSRDQRRQALDRRTA